MIIFGTKSETLEYLSKVITNAKIIPQIRLTVTEWINNSHKIVNLIKEKNWINIPLIVRSSSTSEDNSIHSLAGCFLSIPNVVGETQICTAITKVIESYKSLNLKDQVFIQPMLKNVKFSGVAFSKDPNSCSDYIVINYDDYTYTTDSVTSGKTNNLKTFYYYKHSKVPPNIDKKLLHIVNLIKELESLLSTDSLDIEFAFDDMDDLYLLQVRPLIVNLATHNTKNKDFIYELKQKIQQLNTKHPYLYGDKTIYGVMADWNPAEIIGIRPKPLALSLYKKLITDEIWAYQRNEYGYKNVIGFPLLIDFYGLPYIDLRASFNSFLPANLSKNLCEKLVNYYINSLIKFPSYHDKIEFKIVFSCYTFDTEKKLNELLCKGFNKIECKELSDSLQRLTNNIITDSNKLWKNDIQKIMELKKRRELIYNSNLDIISKIYWLLKDCSTYGTLPFAGLARCGFIAIEFLNSLVNNGVLSQNDYQCFMKSLNTVSSKIRYDFNHISKEDFLNRYGHLRPGTYDILSSRYDEKPDLYFDWGTSNSEKNYTNTNFSLSSSQISKIDKLLKTYNFNCSCVELFDFIKTSIEFREYSKFIFTHNLSDALLLFKELGFKNNFTLEDCSYANINCINELYSSNKNVKLTLANSINEGKKIYETTKQVILPPLIVNCADILAFHVPRSEPNFITQKSVISKIKNIDTSKQNLKNSILMIPEADPGYDWIFLHDIAGFITMYGGINSHMAIRAGELGIPAVIGAGETLYKKWSAANILKIDCANKQVTVIR
ncbi:PEP/pyruvate-binding domain-containing protein [Clostridium hydrogenum]|uniref:PEP/pyruvate-binding domain-containing protein n=1 Tax=Clostridium hydrogenum TaxID=2855764 RepID=UPI001F2430E9|nr:PEP/pyruvate-binding domain-containing protein [Clostridium hydrogenum]